VLENRFPLLLSFLAVILVLGYIRYANDRMETVLERVGASNRLEEGSLAPADLDDYTLLQPMPAITFDLPDSLLFAGEIVPMDIHTGTTTQFF
jgi:hypothetical protein